jgi:F-type H+-transporting ATPase subunit delta
VAREFARLVRLACSRETAIVETATPADEEAQTGIRSRLARLYGRHLSISFVPTPALIGGMRIKVGSDVYDGSVQGWLFAIAARF